MKNSIFKKAAALFLACVMSMFVLAGCGGDGSTTPTSPGEAAAGQTGDGQSAQAAGNKMFNVALTAPFTGFDPMRTNDLVSTYAIVQMYETLYELDPERPGEFKCLLAESLPEMSEDGLTATIKLRSGVTFHDGTPFNGEAVKHTYDLMKNPDFPAARASIVASIDSIETPDENTVVFHLAYPDGVLLAKLAHPNASIVSPTAQANQDLMVDPVGTGPYKFVSSISGSNVVMTYYDGYWGNEPVVKDVTMTVISEESTAVARMETGEADFMPTLSVEQIARVETMPDIMVQTAPSAQVFYTFIRGASAVNPLMEQKDFRVALAKGIDKEGYMEYIMENHGTLAVGLLGPQVFGYVEGADQEYSYGYDPEGAKAILEANGWTDEPVKMLVGSTPQYTKMGEYIQASLSEAGFTNVQIEAVDWSAWQTESKADNRFDITLGAWANVTTDGSELFEPNFHSVAGSHRNRLSPEDAAVLDQLIQESKTTTDAAVRTEKLQACNKLLGENAYVQPLYHNQLISCLNKAYGGMELRANTMFYLKDLTVK